jgi:hypothetical protein
MLSRTYRAAVSADVKRYTTGTLCTAAIISVAGFQSVTVLPLLQDTSRILQQSAPVRIWQMDAYLCAASADAATRKTLGFEILSRPKAHKQRKILTHTA